MDEQICAVRRMQEYIGEHLYQTITLAELSAVSMYSPWHSRRIFERILGITPSDYIRKLRLSRSALTLRDERVKIIDVAFDSGFSSVDGYQRAFYKEFGCNPKEYAQSPSPLYLFIPYYAEAKKKENKMEKTQCVFIQVLEKPARKVLIKRGITAKEYFTYCEEVGCDIWGLLVSLPSIGNEPVCMWLPEKYIKKGTSEYVQGVEVALDFDGIIPDGFDIIKLPASKYLKFQGEPFAEEDYAEAIKAIWEAEKRYNPEMVGFSWDKDNPRIQLIPLGERGYIELMPIK
ncbi:MAG: helix-turn-helix domain-containing protein [Clostridia bacterium]|nr:helix-turn-helix domain-containing protein [Clostridia bacterium]